MSDETLTNAAVERMRSWFDYFNTVDAAPHLDVPDGFHIDDRRSGGFSFGRGDKRHLQTGFSAIWDLGPRPHFSIVEVLGVRGRRCAAFIERIDYGNEMHTEHIDCLQLDEGCIFAERIIQYGLDDTADAIAELDRMHAEIDN